MSSIDFVTVNYKTPDLIKIEVESIKKYIKFPYNIYIVNNGKILAEGTSELILNNVKVRDVYLGEQFSL